MLLVHFLQPALAGENRRLRHIFHRLLGVDATLAQVLVAHPVFLAGFLRLNRFDRFHVASLWLKFCHLFHGLVKSALNNKRELFGLVNVNKKTASQRSCVHENDYDARLFWMPGNRDFSL